MDCYWETTQGLALLCFDFSVINQNGFFFASLITLVGFFPQLPLRISEPVNAVDSIAFDFFFPKIAICHDHAFFESDLAEDRSSVDNRSPPVQRILSLFESPV